MRAQTKKGLSKELAIIKSLLIAPNDISPCMSSLKLLCFCGFKIQYFFQWSSKLIYMQQERIMQFKIYNAYEVL